MIVRTPLWTDTGIEYHADFASRNGSFVVARMPFSTFKPHVKMKIVLGFYSLLAVLGDTFGIRWPSVFTNVLAHIKAAFASLSQLSALACSLHVHHYDELCFWTFGLLGLLGRRTLSEEELTVMTASLLQLFPHMSPESITRDLVLTGSPDLTAERILQGTVI